MSDRNETSTLNGVFNIVPIHCHCQWQPNTMLLVLQPNTMLLVWTLPASSTSEQAICAAPWVSAPSNSLLPAAMAWTSPRFNRADLAAEAWWAHDHDRNLALMTQSYELQWQFCWKFSRSHLTPKTPLQIPLVSEPNKQIPELLTINGLRVWCLCETLVPAWV
jgi:hypothetical protein